MSPRRHRGARQTGNPAPATALEVVGRLMVRPEWRNGRRAGLKIRWGQPRVSSTLTSGINPSTQQLSIPKCPALLDAGLRKWRIRQRRTPAPLSVRVVCQTHDTGRRTPRARRKIYPSPGSGVAFRLGLPVDS